MKYLKLISIFLVVGALFFFSFSCSGNNDSVNNTRTQVSVAQKGTISIEVTGTGNLALAHTQDMAFEVAGTVAEIPVIESQSVKKGDVLAKLDTSVWDKQVKTLENNLLTAQRTLTTRQNDVTKAQRQVTTKQNALPQAELDVKSAENNLDQVTEVKEVQDKIDKITLDLNFAKQMTQASSVDSRMGGDVKYWSDQISYLTTSLSKANKDMKELKEDISVSISTNLSLQIANFKLQIEQKKRTLEDAKTAVDDAMTSVTNALMLQGDAEETVKEAQANLDEAKGLSPIIKAAFDGFITKISIKGGDEILKGKVAMQLADPNQFEANILVTEKDIFSVKLGGDAIVSLDALSGLNFPAKITKIAPLATVSQGVVNYKVTVGLTSLKPITANVSGQRSNQSLTGGTSAGGGFPTIGSFPGVTGVTPPAGGFPAPTGLPFTGGQIPSGVTLPQGFSGNYSQGAAASAASNVTLKDGLTATVTITIQKKENILIVPNRALSRQGKDTVVKIQAGETVETRVVKTGVSDLQNTEITDGLQEGEQIVIITTSSSSSSSSSSGPGLGGGFRMVGPR